MLRTFVGLITLILLGVGGWYLVDLIKTGNLKGDEIRLIIRFNDAYGVPVGGGVVHKGVRVGEVLKVDIAPDDSGVLLDIIVANKFQHTLRRCSRFWVVHPHFGGIVQGASGLDTLIKDPYVEYDTPDVGAPMLTQGSLIYGANQPPVPENDRFAPAIGAKPDPLTFKVRFEQAFGLREGALILYRDVPVGSVLSVDLSLDGRSVEMEALIHSRYRETARTDSVFWVAKPNVEFGFHWPSFVNVQDLSKIITGVALSYATPTDGKGVPLKNNDLVEGQSKPVEKLEDYKGPLVSIKPINDNSPRNGFSTNMKMVGVTLAFTEVDLFMDEQYVFQGTGVLFKGPNGKPMVLTARTLVDGGYSVSDMISKGDISKTDLKVRLADKNVFDAACVWQDPNDRDIAILELKGGPITQKIGDLKFTTDEETDEYYMLLTFREADSRSRFFQPIPKDKVLDKGKEIRLFHKDLNIKGQEWFGAILTDRTGRIVGITGRKSEGSKTMGISVLKGLPSLEGKK